jgi:lipopolysaccharide/colanic/teichoic acid biosynthesis glycosyltransferase
MKRSFDFIVSFFALILLLPFFGLIVVLIKILMPGPVFFSQERIGLGGKPFNIFKFRSMTVNNSAISITLKNDTRVTPFGRFLRKSKIDELPQLWNILKGDMSFVGYRPDVPGYHDRLKGDAQKLLTIKPGLTGADSLAYPDEEDILQFQSNPQLFYDTFLFPDKVRINLAYLQKQSFLLDLKIIIFTLLRKKINHTDFLPKTGL